jgi:nitric-oxide synthase
MLEDALAFLDLYADEVGVDVTLRRTSVEREIASNGSYVQSTPELVHAARVAWRNSVRCIGRLYWNTLEVRDMRHLTAAAQVFEACVEHLELATNGGRIRPVMTVFAPAARGTAGIRIWNDQLIRYAGYRQPDGTVVGDPANVDLTDAIRQLGWEPDDEGRFDVLPLVIETPEEPARFFALPEHVVLEVPISHPEYAWFEELGLRWHGVPAVSNMRFSAGGLSYSCAPFNGWYMGTEIGARNFGDASRYDVLPEVARRMGLATRSPRNLWLDRALVEVNRAVLHSFHGARITLVDHHNAAKHFMRHIELERRAGRETNADWSWIVPPMSGSTTPVFHRYYGEQEPSPNFFAEAPAWKRRAA